MIKDTVDYAFKVKSYIKRNDVFDPHQKALFAEKRLGNKIRLIMIGASIKETIKG